MDHWKMINALKKIFKHWLIFSNNRIQYVKADMQEVFSRWRMGDLKMACELDRQPLKYLLDKNQLQSKTLMIIADKEAESEAQLKHLSLQRDELLEHYIRSQRLALALWRDNYTKGKGKIFKLWQELKKGAAQEEAQMQVMDAVEAMT
mmetsp:Transcript_2768/g.4733  ORF Transcript_2768/g.4733 Transcript_2768/m.4733 type:complete len:148 (-) Transcript_2768:325-768(-)